MIVSEFIAVSQCFLCGIDDGNSKSEMDCQRASIIFWYYSLFGGLEVYKQISFFRFCMCDFICIFEKLNENFQNDKKYDKPGRLPTQNSTKRGKRQAIFFFISFGMNFICWLTGFYIVVVCWAVWKKKKVFATASKKKKILIAFISLTLILFHSLFHLLWWVICCHVWPRNIKKYISYIQAFIYGNI